MSFMKAASKERKIQMTRNYMSDEAFAELKAAMEDALAFQRGNRLELVLTRMPRPKSQRTRLTEKTSGTTKRCQSEKLPNPPTTHGRSPMGQGL